MLILLEMTCIVSNWTLNATIATQETLHICCLKMKFYLSTAIYPPEVFCFWVVHTSVCVWSCIKSPWTWYISQTACWNTHLQLKCSWEKDELIGIGGQLKWSKVKVTVKPHTVK